MICSVLTAFLALALLITQTHATYTLTHSFTPSTFFDAFDFFTDADPTHGTVSFVDQATASATNLTSASSDSVYIGVDSTNTISAGAGRPAVRLQSKQAFNHGLLIADVLHMPGGICGTWPALWMVGPDWPAGGEIDILEGVNTQSRNQMTLHTSANCSVANATSLSADAFTGELLTDDCASNGNDNTGCGISASSSGISTYGSAFNAAGGAVVVMEWTSSAIRIWIMPREASTSTSGALGDSPDPAVWGAPMARFSGACDIDQHFQNMSIVIDTTFCGDWAGKVWQSGGCAASTGVQTCDQYVRENRKAFADAYWSFAGMKFFEEAQASGAERGGSEATGSLSRTSSTAATDSTATAGAPSMADSLSFTDTSFSVSTTTFTSTMTVTRASSSTGSTSLTKTSSFGTSTSSGSTSFTNASSPPSKTSLASTTGKPLLEAINGSLAIPAIPADPKLDKRHHGHCNDYLLDAYDCAEPSPTASGGRPAKSSTSRFGSVHTETTTQRQMSVTGTSSLSPSPTTALPYAVRPSGLPIDAAPGARFRVQHSGAASSRDNIFSHLRLHFRDVVPTFSGNWHFGETATIVTALTFVLLLILFFDKAEKTYDVLFCRPVGYLINRLVPLVGLNGTLLVLIVFFTTLVGCAAIRLVRFIPMDCGCATA